MIENYLLHKEAGRISLLRNGKHTFAVRKQYDPYSGEQLPDKVIQLNIAQLVERRAYIMEELANLEALLKDIADTPDESEKEAAQK